MFAQNAYVMIQISLRNVKKVESRLSEMFQRIG